jgi:hypothetical protein
MPLAPSVTSVNVDRGVVGDERATLANSAGGLSEAQMAALAVHVEKSRLWRESARPNAHKHRRRCRCVHERR